MSLPRAITRISYYPSSSTEHATSGVSKVGDPAQEAPKARYFVSFGHVLRWIPAELGLETPSYGEDDGEMSFTFKLLYADSGGDVR
jgi:hypothetical protein